MRLPGPLRRLWTRAMLRGTAFTRRYDKLKLLYSLEDPWDLGSERERHRFVETNARLEAALGRPARLLELGAGEGHQTSYLSRLADHVCGLEVSERAVERARARCPQADLRVGAAEDARRIFAGETFDLVTACEVLYYADDAPAVVADLQAMAPALFVSNYLERSKVLREHFQGPGWRPLEPIAFEDTHWECFLWERP